MAQMQAVFLDNWIKTTGEVLHGDHVLSRLSSRRATIDAQMFAVRQRAAATSMHLMYLLSITAARTVHRHRAIPTSCRIELRCDALLDARKRGVKVRVVFPGPHIDATLVRRASRASGASCWKPASRSTSTCRPCSTARCMIVDGQWVSVGSANFDNRSFRLNDEANLNVFSEPLAMELAAHVRQRSGPITQVRATPLAQPVARRSAPWNGWRRDWTPSCSQLPDAGACSHHDPIGLAQHVCDVLGATLGAEVIPVRVFPEVEHEHDLLRRRALPGGAGLSTGCSGASRCHPSR